MQMTAKDFSNTRPSPPSWRLWQKIRLNCTTVSAVMLLTTPVASNLLSDADFSAYSWQTPLKQFCGLSRPMTSSSYPTFCCNSDLVVIQQSSRSGPVDVNQAPCLPVMCSLSTVLQILQYSSDSFTVPVTSLHMFFGSGSMFLNNCQRHTCVRTLASSCPENS